MKARWGINRARRLEIDISRKRDTDGHFSPITKGPRLVDTVDIIAAGGPKTQGAPSLMNATKGLTTQVQLADQGTAQTQSDQCDWRHDDRSHSPPSQGVAGD